MCLKYLNNVLRSQVHVRSLGGFGSGSWLWLRKGFCEARATLPSFNRRLSQIFSSGNILQKNVRKNKRRQTWFYPCGKTLGGFSWRSTNLIWFWSRNLVSGRKEGDPPTSGQCVKPSKLPVKTLHKELSEFGNRPLQTLHLPRASSVLLWLTRDAADGDGSGGSAGLSLEPGGSIPALPRQPPAKTREEENAPTAPISRGAARKPPGDA